MEKTGSVYSFGPRFPDEEWDKKEYKKILEGLVEHLRGKGYYMLKCAKDKVIIHGIWCVGGDLGWSIAGEMRHFDDVFETPHLVVYRGGLDEDVREYFESAGLLDTSPVPEKAEEEAGEEKTSEKQKRK